jgi:hypothetical protein
LLLYCCFTCCFTAAAPTDACQRQGQYIHSASNLFFLCVSATASRACIGAARRPLLSRSLSLARARALSLSLTHSLSPSLPPSIHPSIPFSPFPLSLSLSISVSLSLSLSLSLPLSRARSLSLSQRFLANRFVHNTALT